MVGGACVGGGRTSLSWNPCWLVDPSRLNAPRSRHLKMTEDAMTAMHQQFTATLEEVGEAECGTAE